MLITRWYRISGVGSSSPCNSTPGLPLSRQWWVQLSVADTMSVDSSAAGSHFGFWILAKLEQLPKCCLYSVTSVNRQFCLICLTLTHPAAPFPGVRLPALQKNYMWQSLFTSIASDIGTTMGQCCLWPSTCIYV